MTSLRGRHTSREKALPQTTITSEVEQICCGTPQKAFSCHFAVLPARLAGIPKLPTLGLQDFQALVTVITMVMGTDL